MTIDVPRLTGGHLLEVVDIPEWSGPMPAVDPSSAPYFEAAARGALLIERCGACGAVQHYPRRICTRCGATPDWEAASGIGTVYTFSVVHQMGVIPFSGRVPYVVALIDLAEGPRLVGNVVDCEPGAVSIGSPVQCVIHRVNSEVGWPQWRLR